jgi:hypothetical protein
MTSNEVRPHRHIAHPHIWQTLIEFDLATEPGSEHLAVERVAEAVQRLNWPAAHLGQLKLALDQAARKAMESYFGYDSEAPLVIRVLIPENELAPRDSDPANAEPTQPRPSEGEAQPVRQPPSRGWSFFLIEKSLPDAVGAGRHLLELYLYPGGK